MKRKLIVLSYRAWLFICTVFGLILVAIIPEKQRFKLAKMLFGHFKRRLGGKEVMRRLKSTTYVTVPDIGQDVLDVFLRYYKYTIAVH